MVVTGTYNAYLVALSILVASLASYTALDLSGHVEQARGLARRVWLVAAAITMGGGIWSMHFIGMLAFVMPTPMSYDIVPTVVSLLVAIVVTGGGFYVLSRRSASPLHLVLSGIFMGVGIAAMHYTGMAAMQGHAEFSYNPLFVALSLVIAIAASTGALWLAFRTTDLWQKLAAGVLMGLAVSGMHYTGMRAAIFVAQDAVHQTRPDEGFDQSSLALAIAGISFVILAIAWLASLTERNRAEESLRQAQADLARVNRVTTLGELTASLSHELNQPISAVVASANACVRWLAGDTPNIEMARAAAKRMVRDGTRAADIIRTRLLFTKDTSQRELVDINEVIREMTVLLRSEAMRHAISVRAELAPELPNIMGDRVQLQQVTMNLMINGIDAMKDVAGTRELAIATQRAANERVMVSVSDTGVGLPPRQGERIFDPFFTTKQHGIGMGLSISRSIIEAHDGRLWAADNSPHGASFHLVLPAEAVAHE